MKPNLADLSAEELAELAATELERGFIGLTTLSDVPAPPAVAAANTAAAGAVAADAEEAVRPRPDAVAAVAAAAVAETRPLIVSVTVPLAPFSRLSLFSAMDMKVISGLQGKLNSVSSEGKVAPFLNCCNCVRNSSPRIRSSAVAAPM